MWGLLTFWAFLTQNEIIQLEVAEVMNALVEQAQLSFL